jgi:hypothetical protein
MIRRDLCRIWRITVRERIRGRRRGQDEEGVMEKKGFGARG